MKDLRVKHFRDIEARGFNETNWGGTSSRRNKRIDGAVECKKEKDEGLRDIEGSVEVERMNGGGRGTKEKEGIEVVEDVV